MRCIGTLPSQQDANRFCDYLLTVDVRADAKRTGNEWAIWVQEEDALEQAKQELAGFRAAPRDPRYVAAVELAQERRERELKESIAARKRHVNLGERWNRPLAARIPVTMSLIGISIALSLWSNFGHHRERTNQLNIEHINHRTRTYRTDLADVRSGQVWRLVTPIFLHGGWLHLGMNMYMTFFLGASIEAGKGSWRLLLIVLIIAVISNVAQYVGVLQIVAEMTPIPDWLFNRGPNFGGMSGVDFGLFGYIWMMARFAPEDGYFMPRHIVMQIMIWMVLCLTVLASYIANTAHVIGLLAGMACALVPIAFRRLFRSAR